MQKPIFGIHIYSYLIAALPPIGHYDQDAGRFHQGVYQRKRTNLLATINRNMLSCYTEQLRNVYSTCLADFKESLDKATSAGVGNFEAILHETRQRSESAFKQYAIDAQLEGAVIEDVRWRWDSELEKLQRDAQSYAKTIKDQGITQAKSAREVCAIIEL